MAQLTVQVDRRRRPRRTGVMALAAFTLIGLVVAALLATVTGMLARREGAQDATRSFERLAAVVAGSVVAPRVTPELVRGDPDAQARLGRTVDALLDSDQIVGITVRDAAGHVVWSDEHGATPQDRPLSPGQRSALQTGSLLRASDAEAAQGTADDVRTTSVGVRGSDGTPLLVEVAGLRSDMGDRARTAWTLFAPASLGALLLLELIQAPLIWSRSRRLRRHEETEAALRAAAAAATDVERRRIAGQVHDNVLPQLSGLSYGLDAARLSAPGTAETADLLDRTAEGLRTGIRELRAVLVDLSTLRLPDAGLGPALAELAERMEVLGIHMTVLAPRLGDLPREVAEVLYRTAQEALRNVAAHSGAEQVEVTIDVDGEDVTMILDDDGRGFEESRLRESEAAGHLGLRVLGDLVADSGGSLTAASSPGQGTRIVVTVPLDGVGADLRVLQ